MFSVDRAKVMHAAEALAVAMADAKDAAGMRIMIGPMNVAPQLPGSLGYNPSQQFRPYVDAIMGAICQLSGGDAVGMRGDTHLNMVHDEHIELRE